MPDRLQTAPRIAVGTKQTLKAIEAGHAATVYVAQDAEAKVVDPVRSLCLARGVELVPVESMKMLGQLCRIEVGAAAAAILK